jgi:hypothetical protein
MTYWHWPWFAGFLPCSHHDANHNHHQRCWPLRLVSCWWLSLLPPSLPGLPLICPTPVLPMSHPSLTPTTVHWTVSPHTPSLSFGLPCTHRQLFCCHLHPPSPQSPPFPHPSCLCMASMTQRFNLSHFWVVQGVQALILKLNRTGFNIRFHLVDVGIIEYQHVHIFNLGLIIWTLDTLHNHCYYTVTHSYCLSQLS